MIDSLKFPPYTCEVSRRDPQAGKIRERVVTFDPYFPLSAMEPALTFENTPGNGDGMNLLSSNA